MLLFRVKTGYNKDYTLVHHQIEVELNLLKTDKVIVEHFTEQVSNVGIVDIHYATIIGLVTKSGKHFLRNVMTSQIMRNEKDLELREAKNPAILLEHAPIPIPTGIFFNHAAESLFKLLTPFCVFVFHYATIIGTDTDLFKYKKREGPQY